MLPDRINPIDLGALLDDFGPDAVAVSKSGKEFFGQHKRKSWGTVAAPEPRCDFAENHIHTATRSAGLRFIARWTRSTMGRTLSEIKADDNIIPFIADGMAEVVHDVLGHFLLNGDWALVTAPKRRHKERNFASLVCHMLASLLNVKFYEDAAICHSRQRVNAIFEANNLPPNRNIIIFDDIVTTGSTMLSMTKLCRQWSKNSVCFTAIDNIL